MSDVSDLREPSFVSLSGDPGRAVALSDDEHRVLLEGLTEKVLPVMERTGKRLLAEGFHSSQVTSTGGLLTLCVECVYPAITAKLRFQVHRTFALLLVRDPVFCLFTVHSGNKLMEAISERLRNLDDHGQIEGLAEDFMLACRGARLALSSSVMTYFDDIITLALDREELRAPLPSSRFIALRWTDPGLLRAVVAPLLELAGGRLQARFPALQVKVEGPGRKDNGPCRLAIRGAKAVSSISFFKMCEPGGETLLCYEICNDGLKSPVETLEVDTRPDGLFVRCADVETAVGEFLFSVVFFESPSLSPPVETTPFTGRST